MSFLMLLVIAVGVSADAVAVAIAKGLHLRRITLRDAGGLAIGFGLFQALMPLAGWLLGRSFRGYITEVDHWIGLRPAGPHRRQDDPRSLQSRR